ncbi:MAG: hypothetical protein ABJE66_37145 [Deltaproteobacteria bacterium]
MTKLGNIVIVSSLVVAGAAFAGDAAKPAPPAKAMEMPKPADQIAARAKAMTGTWKCDGTAAGMDGKDQKFTGSMASKSDLDGWWVHDSFSGDMGGGKAGMKFKFESYSTYDKNLNKWREVFVDNWGGQMIGTGDEMKAGKMEMASDSLDMMGKGMMKDHTDASDMKKGVHMWGESSKDGGKTWTKSYDMVCKK